MTRELSRKTRCLAALLLCCLMGLGFLVIQFVPPASKAAYRQHRDAADRGERTFLQAFLSDTLTERSVLVTQFQTLVNSFISKSQWERQASLAHLKPNLSYIIDQLFPNNPTGDTKTTYDLASKLLKSAQDLATTIAKDLRPTEKQDLDAGKLSIQTIMSDTSTDTGVKFQYSFSASKTEARDTFEIPVSTLKSLGRNVPIASFVLEGIGAWMQPTDNTTDRVNSVVISASVEGLTEVLAEPVRFVLLHLNASLASPRCSFWQPLDGKWLTVGCEVEQSNQTHTSCRCRHLTSFCVLMAFYAPQRPGGDNSGVDGGSGSGGVSGSGNDTVSSFGNDTVSGVGNDTVSRVGNDTVSRGGNDTGSGAVDNGTSSTDNAEDSSDEVYNAVDDPVLTVLTQILISLSLVALLLSFLTFVGCSTPEDELNTIHIHLVVCLGCGQLLFLVGIDQVGNKTLCAVIAGLLHFLFLGAFCWMLVEGIKIYQELVIVFESEKSWIPYFFSIGYGVPAIIVGICASVNSGGYGTDRHCWLGLDNGFYWSFLGPVVAILFFNMIMLGISMRIMWKHLQFSESQQTNGDEKVSRMIKGCASLSVLLGTSWLFGILQNIVAPIVMGYVFAILTSSQGLFIFIFHCLGNLKVNKEYSKQLREATWMPIPLRKILYSLVSTPSTAELEVETPSNAPASESLTEISKSTTEARLSARGTLADEAKRTLIKNARETPTDAANRALIKDARETPANRTLIKDARETPANRTLIKDARGTPTDSANRALIKDARETPANRTLIKDARETPANRTLIKDARETPTDAANRALIKDARGTPTDAANRALIKDARATPANRTLIKDTRETPANRDASDVDLQQRIKCETERQ